MMLGLPHVVPFSKLLDSLFAASSFPLHPAREKKPIPPVTVCKLTLPLLPPHLFLYHPGRENRIPPIHPISQETIASGPDFDSHARKTSLLLSPPPQISLSTALLLPTRNPLALHILASRIIDTLLIPPISRRFHPASL